jgi:hypothetical protein
MAYDPGTGALLLYGGGRDGEGFGSDLWTLGEENWGLLRETLAPGRILAGMTTTVHGIVLFGGLVRRGPRSRELWEWKRGVWTLLSQGGPPGAIYPGLVHCGADDTSFRGTRTGRRWSG